TPFLKRDGVCSIDFNFIGTAKGYNTPRLASKLKICFRPMPRVPAFVGRQACTEVVYLYYPFILALKNSLFIRAMFSREIPFGHSTSQAPVLVQFPNPSRSIWATIFFTRSVASTLPCG